MVKYKIVYDREGCIGVGTCIAASGKYWEMDHNDKAILKNGAVLNVETGYYELEFPENDLVEVLDSARVCPVKVIRIYKLDESNKWIEITSE